MFVYITLLVIFIFILLLKKKEPFRNSYDIIISINVHEKLDFLLKQLKNIEDHVKLNYLIILNPSKTFYKILKDRTKNLKNVIINDNFFNKKRFHGSLLKGIYYNILLALKKYNFKYFIILSSRSMFYNNLHSTEQIEKLKIEEKIDAWVKIKKNIPLRSHRNKNAEKNKYIQFIKKNNLNLTSCPHEGFTLDKKNCISIKKFMDKNKSFQEIIFSYDSAIEEDLFQNIAYKFDKYFFHIGQYSTSTKIDTDNYEKNKLRKNSFVYKSLR